MDNITYSQDCLMIKDGFQYILPLDYIKKKLPYAMLSLDLIEEVYIDQDGNRYDSTTQEYKDITDLIDSIDLKIYHVANKEGKYIGQLRKYNMSDSDSIVPSEPTDMMMLWNGTEWIYDIDKIRTDALFSIKQSANAMMDSFIEYKGNRYNFSDGAILSIYGLLELYSSDEIISFRTYDNTFVDLSFAELVELKGAMLLKKKTIYEEKWSKNNAVVGSNNAEDIRKIASWQ